MGLPRHAICAALAVVFGLSLAVGARAAERGEPLNIGYVPALSIYWDFYAGVEEGFFKAEGFAPTLIGSQSSPQSIQMIVSGAAQIVNSQPEPLIAAVEHGAKEIAVIGAPADSPDWFLVARPDIKSWADLKGKTLGFSSLRVNEFYLVRRLLGEHGIGPNQFDAIQVGPTSAKFAALERGSIAAGVLFQPVGVLAKSQGLAVLYDFAEIKRYPSVVYVVNRDWAAKNRNGVRLAQALGRAHHWLYDPKNHDAAIRDVQKYTKRPAAVLDAVYQLYFVADKLYTRDGAVDAAGLAQVVQEMVKNGELAKGAALPPSAYLLPQAIGGLRR